MSSTLSSITRRAVLKRIASLSVAPVAAPLALNLMGMANAAAQSATDYKALVCVFLFGANDHYNTIVPYDTTSYNQYYAIRKNSTLIGDYEGIALKRSALAATALSSTVGLSSGLQMALGPRWGGSRHCLMSSGLRFCSMWGL